MNTKRFLVIGTVAGAWLMSGCANSYNPDYSNVDPKSNYGRTSPYLDMNDAEECARQLIDDCLARQVNGQNWTDAFRTANGRDPVIYVGMVKNRTDDPDLQTEQFTNMIEKELLNSGKVRVRSEREGRAELREERQDDVYRDPKYVKSNKAELASDFVLRGEVLYFRQVARSGTGERVDYRVDMELTDTVTTEKVWTKDGRIAKATSR